VTAGCGPRTYPVEGTVVFDDNRPATELAGGFVTFQPVDDKASAQGSIGPEGTFRLSTFRQGDGALPGPYRVVVSPPPPGGASEAGPPPLLLDPCFSDPNTSDIQVTVEPRKNQVTIPVRKPGVGRPGGQ
jgi:hypothetical protein